MTQPAESPLIAPCDSEQSCVAYFFSKRWPGGFYCPFCGSAQPQHPPALIVVCRLCRRQTSITAHTVMHGSKKGLISWIRVAHCFCTETKGISARRLQHLLELSCYQTAWNWLQKIRQAAALAEAAPCSNEVLFTTAELTVAGLTAASPPTIAVALNLERSRMEDNRVRLMVLADDHPQTIGTALDLLVTRQATRLKVFHSLPLPAAVTERYWLASPERQHSAMAETVVKDLTSWLEEVYRGGINPDYLQNYLDEFTFRHNTAGWPNRRAVLDHLLCGLITPLPLVGQPTPKNLVFAEERL
jgi:hypothetical protein